MTANEFVKIVRSGSDKLRVDEIIINTGNQEFHGKGMLEISRELIKIHVTLDKGNFASGNQFLGVGTGIYTKRDRWKMKGVIEDQLEFKCDDVGPVVGFGLPISVTKFTINLHPVDLIPSGFDAMSRVERDEFLKKHQSNAGNGGALPEKPIPVENKQIDFCFYAVLFEYPILGSSWDNVIKGDTKYFDYTIKTIEGSSDIHISLNSKMEFNSSGQEQDLKKLYAFMFALAFATGVDAWPYRIEYWCAGRKILDRVTTARPLSKTHHAAFSDRIAFNAKTGSIKWNFQETIKIISQFYDNESAFAGEITYLHFLFRQAGDDGVHGDITILTLCILFENLIRHIFRELELEKIARKENPVFEQFESAKRAFIKQIDTKNANLDEGHKRLLQTVRAAELFNVKSMFQIIVNHFGLRWEGDMELILQTWQKARNPLVHRGEYAYRSEDKMKETSIAESRIAGAINILSLKLFGYSGFMQHSTFEEGCRQI